MRTILLTLAALLAGCCTPPEPIVRVIDTGCTWTAPIFVSSRDELTDKTAEEIVAHNRTGQEKCGWKPNRKQP